MILDYRSERNKTRAEDITDYDVFLIRVKEELLGNAYAAVTLEPGDGTHYNLQIADSGAHLWFSRPGSHSSLVVSCNEWVHPSMVIEIPPFRNPHTAHLVAQLANDLNDLSDEDSVISFDFRGAGRAVFE